MTGNVVTHSEFLHRMSEKSILESGGHGNISDSELELKAPSPSEEQVSELTEEEVSLFKTMFVLDSELQKCNNELGGSAMIAAGTALRDGKPMPKDAGDVDLDEDLVRAYFVAERRYQLARALFQSTLSERLDIFDWVLGIRTRFRVVKVSRRW